MINQILEYLYIYCIMAIQYMLLYMHILAYMKIWNYIWIISRHQNWVKNKHKTTCKFVYLKNKIKSMALEQKYDQLIQTNTVGVSGYGQVSYGITVDRLKIKKTVT